MFKINVACGCHIGKVRVNNEDNFFFDGICLNKKNSGLAQTLFSRRRTDKLLCFGVFDGMGGEKDGETASFLAARTLKEMIGETWDKKESPEPFLSRYFLKANEVICRQARETGGYIMGSTAVLICFLDKGWFLGNLGDSKVFLFRQNELRQLSTDHTDETLLKQQGITGRRPRLTQYFGIPPEEMTLEPYLCKGELQDDDRFLLCSDGLTDMVSGDKIREILQEKNEQVCVKRLINQSLVSGGKDNVTVILCGANAD